MWHIACYIRAYSMRRCILYRCYRSQVSQAIALLYWWGAETGYSLANQVFLSFSTGPGILRYGVICMPTSSETYNMKVKSSRESKRFRAGTGKLSGSLVRLDSFAFFGRSFFPLFLSFSFLFARSSQSK